MKLNSKYKPTVIDIRANIAARLADLLQVATGLETLTSDEARISAEVEKLEAEQDYANEAGIQALGTKQTQLTLIRRRIETLIERTQPQEAALNAALRELTDALQHWVQPELDALRFSVAEALLPHFGEWAEAKHAASTCPKSRSFVHFYFRRWGESSAAATEAQRALQIVDSVLAGKVLWQFAVEAVPAE
ncbi:MAG: hypothetical protein JWR69_2662 [Pedosphaera sp.]|nr:hypothetical protein [Pedosphaera sp.]